MNVGEGIGLRYNALYMKPWDNWINQSTKKFGATKPDNFSSLTEKSLRSNVSLPKGENIVTGPTARNTHLKLAKERDVSPKEVPYKDVLREMAPDLQFFRG